MERNKPDKGQPWKYAAELTGGSYTFAHLFGIFLSLLI